LEKRDGKEVYQYWLLNSVAEELDAKDLMYLLKNGGRAGFVLPDVFL
jgi:hypothetical protein